MSLIIKSEFVSADFHSFSCVNISLRYLYRKKTVNTEDIVKSNARLCAQETYGNQKAKDFMEIH